MTTAGTQQTLVNAQSARVVNLGAAGTVLCFWVELSTAQPSDVYLAAEKKLESQFIRYKRLVEENKLDEAYSVSLESVGIAENMLGERHVSVGLFLRLAGQSAYRLGRYTAALELHYRELVIFEREDVSGLNAGITLFQIGLNKLALKQPSDAKDSLSRSLQILDEKLTREDPSIAYVLTALADAYRELGQFEVALLHDKKALTLRERVLESDNLEIALSVNNIGISQYHLGRYREALEMLERAAKIRSRLWGEENPIVVEGLRNIGFVLRNLGRANEAVVTLKRVVNLSEKTFGKMHPETATAMNMLAQSYQVLGDYESAINLHLSAINIYKISSNESLAHSIALGDLSVALRAVGRMVEAEAAALETIDLQEKSMPLGNPEIATALNNLASIYFDIGEYEKALPILEKALAINIAYLGKDHPDTAFLLNSYGITVGYLGRYGKALEILSQAYSLQKNTLGVLHSSTALTLNNLGYFSLKSGRVDDSIDYYEKASAGYIGRGEREHPEFLKTTGNLAVTYVFKGDLGRALSMQLQVLGGFEKKYGLQHPTTVIAANEVASTYARSGQYRAAFDLLSKVLSISEGSLGASHPSYILTISNLAYIIDAMGDQQLAIVLLKEAVNYYQVRREKVSALGKDQLVSFTATFFDIYQKLATLLIEQGRLSEAQQVLDMLKEDEQFEFIRRASDADPRGSRIGYTGTEQAWLKRYREIADQLGKLGAEVRELEKQAKLGLTPEQKQRQQAIAADLKVAQTAFQSFLGEMREGLAQKGQARKVEVEEISAQAMRESQSLIKGLGDDVALLQYYITDKRVGMLLTTPGIQLARSSDIDSKELNRKIGELRRLLQDPKSNPVAAAQELYRVLVAPVAKDLEDAKIKTVMLSLDGALRYLPFGALHDGKQYLVDRWNLPMYTSVTRNKLRDTVSPQWQAAGLGVTKAWPEFKPLAGVQAEMGAIVKTAAGGFMPGEVYLDEAFTASRLKDVGQRKFPLMHVASHFRFSPGTEVNSFLLLGDGERLTLGDIRTQNYRFDNVELLTLSACDTGLGGGRDEQGKEIEGFGVIAQQQGAKAVLATLWPVADESTATLMADLYRRRQSDSLTKIEALRQSQIAMRVRTKYAHPYYWAPFILMGNWK